jgi:hypothetical protein
MEASGAVPTPTHTPLDLTDLCAQYLLAQFQSELCRRSTPLIGVTMAPNLMPNTLGNTTPALRLQLPVRLVLELDSIAKIIAGAFKNRGE